MPAVRGWMGGWSPLQGGPSRRGYVPERSLYDSGRRSPCVLLPLGAVAVPRLRDYLVQGVYCSPVP